jgi:hypothetical protein
MSVSYVVLVLVYIVDIHMVCIPSIVIALGRSEKVMEIQIFTPSLSLFDCTTLTQSRTMPHSLVRDLFRVQHNEIEKIAKYLVYPCLTVRKIIKETN